MAFRFGRSFGVAALSLLPAGIAIAADATTLPRYAFVRGQELVYRMKTSMVTVIGGKTTQDEAVIDETFWVERANNDGSFRLILSNKLTGTTTSDGKTTPLVDEPSLLCFDIFPDGRELPIKQLKQAGPIPIFFPPLPKNVEQMRTGWEAEPQGFRFTCKPAATTGGFVFDATETPPSKVAGNRQFQFIFDLLHGFVSGSKETFSQREVITQDGTRTITMLSRRILDDETFRRISINADRYFASHDAYEAAIDAATDAGPADAPRIMAAAGVKLKAALDGLTEPVFKTKAQAQFGRHDEATREVVQEATVRASLIGKEAFAFTTTGLDGNVARLADQRGKVVVLDFWYRGCPWCAVAMPQVNQLVADFANKPVVFYGMSVDQNLADARYFVKQVDVKSTPLRAEKLADAFGVTAYPTIIVIDQQGKIRHVETSASSTIRNDIGKLINDLLKTP